MKNTLFIILIIMISKLNGFSQVEKNAIKKDAIQITEYRNYGIRIAFEGSIEIIKMDYKEDASYFNQSLEIIRFNENNKIIDPNTQHLLSEEGPKLLLSTYPDSLRLSEIKLDTHRISTNDSLILDTKPLPTASAPSISKRANKESCSLSNPFSYFSHLSTLYLLPKLSKKELDKEIQSYVKKHPPFQISEKSKLSKKRVYKWRIQNGKTRLDHYLFSEKTIIIYLYPLLTEAMVKLKMLS